MPNETAKKQGQKTQNILVFGPIKNGALLHGKSKHLKNTEKLKQQI